MTIKVDEYYKELVKQASNITDEALIPENLDAIGKSHMSISDYESWIIALNNKPETIILQNALREYQMAILASVTGKYNLAFQGLRFFLERTLTAINFSSKEIELRLWAKGERDTYWNEIINDETGLFSNKFTKAFFPELKSEALHFSRMTTKVYRECSEFVHGNASIQEKIPEKYEYNNELFLEWHNKASIIKTVVLFALCLRYLPYIEKEKLPLIESGVIDELGHITAIRTLFGGTI